MVSEVVDPLEAVMGEDWGILKIPASMRGPMLQYVLELQKKIAGGGGGGSGSSSWTDRMTTAFLAQKPQAMAKLIRTGGTSDLRGIRDQMDYLRKEGTVELERSDRYFGLVVDQAAEAEMMTSWQLADAGDGRADRTSHFMVSFPEGTDHSAAYRTGRAWAEEMFASGKYGDHFDYFTAFHTDRAHPHMHIVVNRRGLEEGSWLKVSPRGHFDYDEMRFVQVRVAADHGIELEATPRFARGVEDRPYTDCEVQRARREERSPQTRAHDAVSRLKVTLAKNLFVRQVRGEASFIEGEHPKYSLLLRESAQLIEEGRQLKAAGPAHQAGLKRTFDSGHKFYGELVPANIVTIKEIREMNAAIDARRAAILSNFEKIDSELSSLPEGPDKTRAERLTARTKTKAAQFMADVAELQGFRRPAADKAYQGVTSYDDFTDEVAGKAKGLVMDLSRKAGLQPEIIVERYGGDEPVARAVAEGWKQAELRQLSTYYQQKEGLDADASQAKAGSTLETVHAEIRDIYSAARRDIEAYEGRKARLVSSLGTDDDVNDRFAQTVKETLTSSRIRELENGDRQALSSLTQDPDQQFMLARRYLETELADAEGARKGKIELALGKLDRDLENEQAKRAENAERRPRRDEDHGL
ncbi:relaxase/mobilization nuclease domain-containing protein [Roseibium sediminicola]|uniref:Relaxase/mobilization nuclease domain-containing protein n=1 Tax=Roseibium sediminicola TaxID=2933272 RepID=A0ABT0H2M0_9HYPH|nr:relaxase/mobilization nuclease domain-containing protein [Roseibium sp. CAU 1639]MCK7615932.1 relaxase/mobilization nuclease domain-containing protein [Roseibium sp. CAU 1639]